MPQAADVLRSVLDGLEELFRRTRVGFWDEQVRGRSRQLIDVAMDPGGHAETRAQLEAVRPAFEALGLPFIPLPYNRPDRGPNDRCRTCGADSWTTTHWLMVHDPPRLEPFPG